ncbi:methyltransferase FkbM family protein [alpha proteobacterium BAL199]|jgi:FkbM family methyltransferase|nr:methyltransferase FkbM family protein [alpha proteobacterium BAL199]
MTGTAATNDRERATAGRRLPYELARGLANRPREQACRDLRLALVLTPGDPDLNALALWHLLRCHRVEPATLRRINRLLVVVRLLDRPLTTGNAFEACVLARQATQEQSDPHLFFRYATVAHACGMIAFWDRYGRSLSVEHHGRRYDLRVGDAQVSFNVAGPQLGLFFDFFFVHEPGMWAWLAEMSPSDVLLDVGANVGLYSIAAAGLRGCRSIGLEPFPVNIDSATANIAMSGLSDCVRMLPVAAAARSGSGRLSHREVIPGVAAQAFHGEHDAAAPGDAQIEVEGAAIDDLVERGAIPFPTHVKIDVDGGEDGVIAGMERTLADPRLDSVRMEIRWWEPGKQAVVDRLKRHGFEPKVDDDRKNLLFRRSWPS